MSSLAQAAFNTGSCSEQQHVPQNLIIPIVSLLHSFHVPDLYLQTAGIIWS